MREFRENRKNLPAKYAKERENRKPKERFACEKFECTLSRGENIFFLVYLVILFFALFACFAGKCIASIRGQNFSLIRKTQEANEF